MRFDIITLFPELIAPYLEHGVNRRATSAAGVQVRFWNPRDFAEGAYRRVDDRPFGGGPGMVMLAEPLARCLQAIREERAEPPPQAAPLLFFSPVGQVLSHALVARQAGAPAGAILLCGRYEGVDQRFIDAHVDQQISLGDFVLSGGEVAAAVFLDAVLRLQPAVLHDAQSHAQDSFNPAISGLLDCPHYTRPEVWQGRSVPAVLTSGDHARIARWRRQQSLALTARQRPELLQQARQQGWLDRADERYLAESPPAENPGQTG
ncbi:tRNA (guanosine(37)-N1)-methyltransferase TrmD [Corticibacter populi]|uniref:tRNA (guanine-N(1)-)-methyltransferase n=1 Tax=Corticibacter populi TaxID=1550736 RepID=A0A3M6R1G3_9BURK|nr:tRNA (guanosine(37)-N1)-methyltransferase TrmD [Corticibacter populi]RMX08582.1 tRNA (guanosine(37)-N1)-methyltransferase TrmD [Corticibacter populi]RZS35906.1 tRNA (guanine37-N(1)-) methyltransferase [Corticibacter populi]